MTDRLAATNPRIKRLRRLISQRKARSQERAFVVEGPTMVAEALAGPLRPGLAPEAVYVEDGYRPELLTAARAAGVDALRVAPGVLQGALDTRSPQPAAAVITGSTSEPGLLGPDGMLLVLFEPSDPGNLGTVIRSAEAAGAAGVVIAGHGVDPMSPKVVRATAGAILRFPVVFETDVDAALAVSRRSGRRLLATVLDSAAPPPEATVLDRSAVLLGNEAHGLTVELIEAADGVVTIPMAGPTESLNLAVTAAVLCFEAARQARVESGRGK